MRKTLTALALLAAGPGFAAGLEIQVEGEANGTIKIDLFEDVAPAHVEQITALAAEGTYDGVVFHRVIDGFMAQTGDVQFGKLGGDMSYAGRGGSSRPDLPAEFSDLPFDRGVVGMARGGDPECSGDPFCKERKEFLNSANSQFFIMFAPTHQLNNNYTVVGKVTEGMDVVDAIKRGTGRFGSVIGKPDTMTKVTVTE